jgi:hypothetical protein
VALVATNEQLPLWVVDISFPETKQSPVAEYVTAPLPDPPEEEIVVVWRC